MARPINFDKVSDIYDSYVKVDFDIQFFLNETREFKGEILELMCGTGRVSIPLLESGKILTCVDYSRGMLVSFANKIKGKKYSVDLIQMDVTKLDLKKKFGLILLPFHSLSEIISEGLQNKALRSITNHLEKDGVFILTLQNPKVRLKSADGVIRVLGEFIIEQDKKMIISYMNKYNPKNKLVSGFQLYEIYDLSNNLIEKRQLDINFRPITDSELKDKLKRLELDIINVYGDYSYNGFHEETSNFMIYKLKKK